MSGFLGSGIPEHVVAYAAGVWSAYHRRPPLLAPPGPGPVTAQELATVVRGCGMGWHKPPDLLAAVLIWIANNVQPETSQ